MFNGSYHYQDLDNQEVQGFFFSMRDLEQDVMITSNSNYSITGFTLIAERRSFPYLARHYLPATLMVIVSWIGFAIPPEVVPARTGLQATLLLVLISLFGNVQVLIRYFFMIKYHIFTKSESEPQINSHLGRKAS